MPLSDVQLGGIAVPRNEVGFLCVAFTILSEDGEGIYIPFMVYTKLFTVSTHCKGGTFFRPRMWFTIYDITFY